MNLYQSDETRLLHRIINWIVDIVVVVAFAWFSVYAFGTQITLAGNSMLPLLKPDDVVLMNQLCYDLGTPKRFDIVVFQRENNKSNVKRIIGLPGETIQIKEGLIYIDDDRLEAEKELNKVSLAGLAENPVHLGEEEYFLLGDNRDSSEDSRFANIGNVNRKQIIGKVWFRILPMLDIDLIRSK